jgi:hypothetical protein
VSNLDDLVKNTIKKAPTRTKNFLIALWSLQQLGQGAQEIFCEGRQLWRDRTDLAGSNARQQHFAVPFALW